MKLYEKIKKEHLFVFIIILTALILFSYFDFGYTGLTVQNPKNTCTGQGYACCQQGTGKGTNYFSLDNTCLQGQSCWAYCEVSYNSKNLVSGYSVFTDVFDNVVNFFKKLFKPSVGLLTEQCTGAPNCSLRRTQTDCNQYGLGVCQWISGIGGGVCAIDKGCRVIDTQNICSSFECTWQGTTQYFLEVTTSGSGTVKSIPTGIDCGTDCTENYNINTQVTLTATPSAEGIFTWGGACSGTGTCTVIMNSAKTVTATFTLNPQCTGTPTVVCTSFSSSLCGAIKDCRYDSRIDCIGTMADCEQQSTTYCAQIPGCGLTTTNPPSAPSNLQATATSLTQVDLQWQDTSNNEYGFKIERSTSQTSGFIQIAQVGPNSIIYTNTGLTSGITYYYRVRAYNYQGNAGLTPEQNSAYTNTVSITPGGTAGTYTLNINKVGSGTVLSEDERINCGGSCSASYQSGTSITLNAGASPGSTFAGWGGDCSGTATCVLTMNSNKQVTATFNAAPVLNPTVSVNHSPLNPTSTQQVLFTANAQFTSSAGGIAYIDVDNINKNNCAINSNQGTCSYSGGPYAASSTHSYKARVFDYNSNSWAENQGTFTVSTSITGTYTLTVTKTGTGSGTVNISYQGAEYKCFNYPCTQNIQSGVFVKLIAEESFGSLFTSWQGDCTGISGNTCTIINMNSNKQVTANFNVATGNSPIAPSNLAANAVSSSQINLQWQDTSNNEDGFKIERLKEISTSQGLTTAATGLWEQIAVVGQNVESYSDTSLTSNTKYEYRVRAYNNGGNSEYSNIAIAKTLSISGNYTLTVNKVGSGTVTGSGINCGASCNADYSSGTSVTLTATASSGYIFTGWSGDCSGTSCIVTMNSNKQVTATFTSISQKEICNNDLDDDNDGAIDELDTDCPSGAYINLTYISPTYSSSSTPAKQPWEDSDIDLICRISVSGSTLEKAKNCVFARVNETSCKVNDENLDQNINFVCNVGSLGVKNVSCNLLKNCFTYPLNPIRHLNYTINVTKPVLCKTIIGGNKLEVSNIDLDASSYEVGDTITSTLTITNTQVDKSVDITVSAQLYDINKRTLIKSVNKTQTILSNFESKDYKLDMQIPSVSESKFKLYYKIYEQSKESNICLEAKNSLDIQVKGTSCQDSDNDGYTDETCGGNDCNDNDAAINHRAIEICTDNKDNNCDGLVDNKDPACVATACVSESVKNCGQGICAGTQTCVNGEYGQCTGGQQPTTEICSNGLDDDCNGFTDSNDPSCATNADSDNDGLPDSWELEHFNSLQYNAQDDPDKDGFSNLEEYDANTDPNNSNDHPQKPSLFKTVLIVILVLVVALFLVWYFALRPKKPGFTYKPTIQQTTIKRPFLPRETTKVSPVLKEYVENSLKKGYNKEQIKKALLTKGWKDQEIEQAFKK